MTLAHNPRIVTDGLVLCLDAANPKSYSGTGTVWKDLSKNSNDGTLVNGVGFSSENNGAMVFDGINNFVDLGVSEIVNLKSSEQWSILIWGKRFSSDGYFISKGYQNAANQQYGIWGASDGINYTIGGTNHIFNITETNIWMMLTLVSNGNSTLTGYYNDNVVILDESVSSLNRETTSTIIGSRRATSPNNGFGYPLDGSVAQVSIYNRVLTPEEIQQNYNALKGRYGL